MSRPIILPLGNCDIHDRSRQARDWGGGDPLLNPRPGRDRSEHGWGRSILVGARVISPANTRQPLVIGEISHVGRRSALVINHQGEHRRPIHDLRRIP
jgi:hypothetical protein